MPQRTQAVLQAWWDQIPKSKKEHAQAGYYTVKADKQTAKLLLNGAMAPPLSSTEQQDLQRDGTLPRDVQTFIMRHD